MDLRDREIEIWRGDELDYFRVKESEASLHLGGMEYGPWEEFGGDGLTNLTAETECEELTIGFVGLESSETFQLT